MTIIHYYHIYADGYWQYPYVNHLEALVESGLIDTLSSIRVGIVGTASNRKRVKQIIPSDWKVVAEAQKGWEQVTMHAFDLSEDSKVFYAHTKGAARPSTLSDSWRESMTNGCVHGWNYCSDLLDERADAVGLYWRHQPWPHFSGTFWWTTTDYLRSLSPLETTTRFDAERWIGQGPKGSRMADLCSGPVHRLNILKKSELKYLDNKLSDEAPVEVTFFTNSKIAGFQPKDLHTVRMTPFIKNCIDKGHFTVVNRTKDPVKIFRI